MKTRRSVILILFIIAMIPLVLFHIMNPEKYELNDDIRSRLGGSYIPLSGGVTHYALEGPENGQVVVLVHGGTVPMFTWDAVSPVLTDAGYRVLRYDMYGRGYSDRPPVKYNRNLYREQLLELLDKLNLKEPVDLVGYSFGGGIVTDLTARHPQRVRQLALISPVVYNFKTPRIFRIPVLGEFLARIAGIKTVIRRANSMYEGTALYQRHSTLFAEQTTFKGFQASLLSMIRSDAIGDYRDSFKSVGKQKRNVLLIWGSLDKEIPEDVINTVRKLIPDIQFHAISDAGHNLVFQKPELIGTMLDNFLRKKDSL
ncbi:MAG: alpha/beta hydrolase [Desulfobacterales bacterium]